MNSKEVAYALSVLRENQLPVNLPEGLRRSLDEEFLFDGDDYLFKTQLNNVQVYGEYGCGKSTVWVANHLADTKIISVDTSFQWVTRTNGAIGRDDHPVKYIDVGSVGDWGRPLGYTHRHSFWDYIDGIWNDKAKPDLVLVDGRFRVACFLNTIVKCQHNTRILFDDYRDRKNYHVVEEILRPVDMCGRQALFEVSDKRSIDTELARELAQSFAYVMD